jgi:excisionase family DNA binding protein
MLDAPKTPRASVEAHGARRANGTGGMDLDGKLALVADGLVTVPEAAKFLSLSRASIYGLMADGRLAFVKLGRSRRIPRRAMLDLAARALGGA